MQKTNTMKRQDKSEKKLLEENKALLKELNALKSNCEQNLQKQNEEQLKQKEFIFRIFADYTSDWEYWEDENNQVVYMSPSCLKITGYSPDEFKKDTDLLYRIIHSEDVQTVKAHHSKAYQYRNRNQIDTIEFRIIKKDQSLVYIYHQCRPIFDSNKNFLGRRVSNRDISDRIKAREELRQSEAKFRTLFKSAYEGIWGFDKNDKTILINERMANLLHAKTEDIMGKPFQNFIQIDDLQDFKQKKLNRKKGESEVFERFYTLWDGSTFWARVSASPRFDAEGNFDGSLGVITDITDRKLAEEQLKASEQRFRLLYEKSPAPYQSLDENGLIVEVNSAWLEELGYNYKEVIQQPMSQFIAKEHLHLLQSRFPKFKAKGVLHKAEFNFVSKKQKIITYEVEGRIGYNLDGSFKQTHCVLHNITERKLAEKKLRSQQLLFEIMFNSLSDGVVITNTEREIILANQGMKTTFGYETSDLLGNTTQMLYADPSLYNDAGKKVFSKDSNPNEKLYLMEYRAKDGETFPGETFGTKLFDSSGQWIGNLGIIRNVAERQKLISDLVKAKERAEESDQLKSAFLANMSHEIRTPMNGIMGFAELLKDTEVSHEEQQEYINIIERSGKRMLNIINDIVDISKIEAGMMKLVLGTTNINEQMRFIYDFFQPEVAAKGMSLELRNELTEKEALVVTDSEKLYAVLTNLVKNAIKYSSRGKIEIGCQLQKSTRNPMIHFYVKDEGIGIAKSRQSAVFERFIQADIFDEMARQGAGLGLTISKAYIEMLGGTIGLESEENKGSTFYFDIPYKKIEYKPDDQENYRSTQHNAFLRKKIKILIAEDDENSALLLNLIFKPDAKEILLAKTGREAVDICRKHKDIDIILMDVRMPEMNGFEATKEIRTFNKKVIILAQTAFALSGDREKAIEAGCTDYISKPIKKEKILQKLNDYF
jgi:PAS domain S-box-containing protein